MRTLFSREELGVTQMESYRKNIINQFESPETIDSYKKEFIENFPNLLLIEKRNNLKEYILLMDKNPDDLKALKSMLLQYTNAYNSSVHNVRDFCFGTEIMRMFYLLNLPDDAVKVIVENYKIHSQTTLMQKNIFYFHGFSSTRTRKLNNYLIKCKHIK